MKRRSLLFLLVCALALLPGCSLLGLGLGSQIPHYQTVTHATRGDALYLDMDDGDVVHGAAVVVEPQAITVLGDNHRERVVETKHVKQMSRRHGSEWLSTFLIGLGVDVAIGIFVAVGLTQTHSTATQGP